MPEKYEMGRRGFLKGIVATALASTTALASQTDPNQVNKGHVYEKAKKVRDLLREAWYPERCRYQGPYSRVMGILNLEPTGNGRYLLIVNNERTDRPKEECESTLELTLVSGIDQDTTKRIDSYLANLWLKYTPPIEGMDQDYIKEINKSMNEHHIEITPTIAALFTIWEKNILGYAKEHNLNVLRLESGSSKGLGSLYSVGIGKEGKVPSHMAQEPSLRVFGINFPTEFQGQIVRNVYSPLLTKVIPQLEKEIGRITNLRSDRERIALEKAAEERLKRKAEEERRLEQKDSDLKKLGEQEELIQTLKQILGYPI